MISIGNTMIRHFDWKEKNKGLGGGFWDWWSASHFQDLYVTNCKPTPWPWRAPSTISGVNYVQIWMLGTCIRTYKMKGSKHEGLTLDLRMFSSSREPCLLIRTIRQLISLDTKLRFVSQRQGFWRSELLFVQCTWLLFSGVDYRRAARPLTLVSLGSAAPASARPLQSVYEP